MAAREWRSTSPPRRQHTSPAKRATYPKKKEIGSLINMSSSTLAYVQQQQKATRFLRVPVPVQQLRGEQSEGSLSWRLCRSSGVKPFERRRIEGSKMAASEHLTLVFGPKWWNYFIFSEPLSSLISEKHTWHYGRRYGTILCYVSLVWSVISIPFLLCLDTADQLSLTVEYITLHGL